MAILYSEIMARESLPIKIKDEDLEIMRSHGERFVVVFHEPYPFKEYYYYNSEGYNYTLMAYADLEKARTKAEKLANLGQTAYVVFADSMKPIYHFTPNLYHFTPNF